MFFFSNAFYLFFYMYTVDKLRPLEARDLIAQLIGDGEIHVLCKGQFLKKTMVNPYLLVWPI